MGIVLSTIDVRTGPLPLYSNLDQSLAKKIAIKSMISTMSFSRESDNENSKIEGEAIIPFPDENIVCFIYYTTIDQISETGDNRLISLSLATETRKVGNLYKSAPKISAEAKRIAQLINTTYEYPNPISEVLKTELNKWESITLDVQADAVQPLVKTEVKPEGFNFQDLFELFKDKKKDPIARILVAFFWSIPVCIIGNDPEFLLEIANMYNEMFKPKDLHIEMPTASEIPRSDIICLTNDQYSKAKFFDDPILVSSGSTDILEMNIEIDKASLGIVEEWLKKARRRVKSDVEFALKTLHDESKRLIGKLEVLVQMANSRRSQSLANIMTKLQVNKVELDFLIYIILNYPKYCSLELLNQLLQPKTPHVAFKIHDKTKIGYIMV